MKPAATNHRSIWLADAPLTTYPQLSGSHTADVTVIGGGIAGLTTALLLQRAGRQVALLEGDRIGCGVTGSSNAKVTSLHGKIYSEIVDSFDGESARIYAKANQAGLHQIAELAAEIKTNGIDCRFERQAAFTFTCDPSRVELLQREAEVAAVAGLPASFTTTTELPLPVRGAVRVERQAQLDPYAYCIGIVHLLVSAGGQVFESSRATDVQTGDGDLCRVVTADGEVRSSHVVVATLLPFLDRGGFFATTAPNRSYAISVSLTGDVPEGMYLGIDSPTRSVRPLPDRSGIIVVGEHHKTGQDPNTRDRYAAIKAWARESFAVRSIDHQWSAQDYITADSLPYIGKMPRGGDRIWTATGFNKWGLTTGTFAAMILRDLIGEKENAWAPLFDATRINAVESAKRFVTENTNVAKRFVGDRLKNLNAPDVNELAPGEGGIVTCDGEKVAAFRDRSGTVHVCSPVCTHLGCFVQWNSAETTWDCPCHGSRFSNQGEILQGPAVAPLDYRQVADEEASP